MDRISKSSSFLIYAVFFLLMSLFTTACPEIEGLGQNFKPVDEVPSEELPSNPPPTPPSPPGPLTGPDIDGDGIYDIQTYSLSGGAYISNPVDNCINTHNTDQVDSNSDGTGDACDSNLLPMEYIYAGRSNTFAHGNHKVLYIQGDFTGSADTPLPQSQVLTEMQKVKAFFEESSYGNLTISGLVDSSSPMDFVGPIVLSRSGVTCLDGTGDSLLADELYQYGLNNVANFNSYDQVVISTPNLCGYNPGGINIGSNGYSVGTYSVVHDQSLNDLKGGLIAHEIGHEFGLDHSHGVFCGSGIDFNHASCDKVEYLDFLDSMGSSMLFGHFNAYQKEMLGWFEPGELVVVESSGEFVLHPFEDLNSSRKALRFKTTDGDWMYLEYRTASGFNQYSNGGIDLTAAVQPLIDMLINLVAPIFNFPGINDASILNGYNDGLVIHWVDVTGSVPGAEATPYILRANSNGGYALSNGQIFDEAGIRIEVVSQTASEIRFTINQTW